MDSRPFLEPYGGCPTLLQGNQPQSIGICRVSFVLYSTFRGSTVPLVMSPRGNYGSFLPASPVARCSHGIFFRCTYSIFRRREVERPDISAWQMLQKVDFYLLPPGQSVLTSGYVSKSDLKAAISPLKPNQIGSMCIYFACRKPRCLSTKGLQSPLFLVLNKTQRNDSHFGTLSKERAPCLEVRSQILQFSSIPLARNHRAPKGGSGLHGMCLLACCMTQSCMCEFFQGGRREWMFLNLPQVGQQCRLYPTQEL